MVVVGQGWMNENGEREIGCGLRIFASQNGRWIRNQSGPFRLNARERLLLRNNEAVPLTPKSFDLVLALVD